APVVAGALGGLIIAEWTNQFRTAANQHPAPASQQGPRGFFSPKPADVNAWKQYDQAVTSAGRHAAAFPGNILASVFTSTGRAATAAKTDVGSYTTAIVQNGLNSDKAQAARAKLVRDMTAAGISSATAHRDVSAYSLAVEVNGARSDQARAARQRLNGDIEKAFRNSRQGKTDLSALTAAVTRNGAQSDAARAARQRLIADLVRAGTDAGTARSDVNNLQTAISKMHGKGISISMSGKGYYTITEAGKNYQISAGGLFSPHAAGGFISGGVPGRDSVPGMLMPGEVVVPAGMVKAGAVDHLRGALPGFASGGAVGPVRTGEAGIGRFYRADVNDEGYSLVSAMRKALKTAEAAARAAARAAAAGGGPGGPGGGAGVARWAGVILQALSLIGQPASWLNTVERRMNQESGGNPNIVNKWDSNWRAGHPSVGLMQVIAGTYAQYAGRFRNTGPFEYGVSVNPLANTYAGLNYALHTYGSLSALNRAGGYAQGGLVPGYASGGSVGKQGAAYLKAWQT
ncbi:MAG TPA: transglycosylase SLT domain-containing protein, partial [Streptosporangiaceae bacterium]